MSFEGHTANITGIGFHCEGKWMVTSSEDSTIRVWDTRTAAQQRRYECAGPVNDVVIHPNQGELISVDRTGTVSIWDLGRSRRAHSITPAMEDVSMSSVTVATDGTLLATSNNRVRHSALHLQVVSLTKCSGRSLHLAYGIRPRQRRNHPLPMPGLPCPQRHHHPHSLIS